MSRADSGAASLLHRIWSGDGGPAITLASLPLVPAEAVFRSIVWARNRLYDNRLLPITSCGIEVVSVGNLRIGGTGKTPVAAWLARRFVAAGRRPAIIHGGYAADEPELHRQWSGSIPVIVGRDRVAAVRRAEEGGADVAVLDDGFQHRRLARDVDIVLVGAEAGLSNVRLLPRGPWREPTDSLSRATAVVVTRKAASREAAQAVADRIAGLVGPDRVATVAIAPAGWRNGGVEGTVPEGRVLAVAALAEPEPFAENAIEAGAKVGGTLWFRDHHEYTVDDVQRILEAAGSGAVVTTAKDAVKLASLLPPSRLWVLEQKVVVESGATVLDRITGDVRQ
jgi:tetraacyldisaccharide 4'-kinase